MIDQILADGFAKVRLNSAEVQRLLNLQREAAAFFAADESVKLRYSLPNRISGYRPHAYAHAGDPYKPDLNDSFIYWKHRREMLPHHDEIASLLDAFEAYRVMLARIVSDLVASLRSHYGSEHELPFEQASVLQVNSFAEPTDREFLQTCHEDAILVTVHWASDKGFEIVSGNEIIPFTSADELLIMPASIMTLMSGGEIQPVRHRVRNHGILNRVSIMYFVSPDATTTIEPFVVNDYNRTVDIRELVIQNPQTAFGLSEEFISS
jgi:isopenicillin N synthase-like dioxygenase